MMVLHNLLKAVRQRNRLLNYHAYSPDFYARAYSVSLFPRFHVVSRDPAAAVSAAVLPGGAAQPRALAPAAVRVVAQLPGASARGPLAERRRGGGPGGGGGSGPAAVRHAEPQPLLLQPEPVHHLLAGHCARPPLRGHHRLHHSPQGVAHPFPRSPRRVDRAPRPPRRRASGVRGTCGDNGVRGASGDNGVCGTNGVSGTCGTCGTNGICGDSGAIGGLCEGENHGNRGLGERSNCGKRGSEERNNRGKEQLGG